MERYFVQQGWGSGHDAWVIKDRTKRRFSGHGRSNPFREVAGSISENNARHIASVLNMTQFIKRMGNLK